MILKKLIRWFSNLFKSKKVNKYNLFRFEIVEELPEKPKVNVFYIEGNKAKKDYWYGLLICPCGCKETIMLNLMDDVKPCWKVSILNVSFSISPSIWRTKNCKSHFWLRDNKIIWCD